MNIVSSNIAKKWHFVDIEPINHRIFAANGNVWRLMKTQELPEDLWKVGRLQQQDAGYQAFVPGPFPPQLRLPLPPELECSHAEAMHAIGKLDGVTKLLPDRDFFLTMYMRREAASSSQIEGTKATIEDAIEVQIRSHRGLPDDVCDITHYVKALGYGLERFDSLPLSLRMIKEVHRELMSGARSTQYAFPGEMRRTQNWIHGTSPSNAAFVPPPPSEIPRTMGDLETFIHSKRGAFPPLVKAALLHSQFETIHPFVDGNGRTGRLLITLYLKHAGLLEVPVLYLSDFFKLHQEQYYRLLQGYHAHPSGVFSWMAFFFQGVMETSQSATDLAYRIMQLRTLDFAKIHSLGKTAAPTALAVLTRLYAQPIVDISQVQEWLGFKSRTGATKVIDRLCALEILSPRHDGRYGRQYEYAPYLRLFAC